MKRISVLICGLILSAVSWAHGDEDHGTAPHPEPVLQAGASAESASSDFEVLATMQGEQLTIYLNRYADNRPVSEAQLEVESGAFKAKLKPVASGVYQVSAAPLAKVGEHALAITVLAGEQADLLDASLSVASSAESLAAASAATEYKNWIWGAGAAALLLLAGVYVRRRGGNQA
ncbi:hypothetical protein [Chitinibacter sp. ZOR0017]|uniref:hypothetical protein n=1 Tax=Chitinibacter sp. ZOR0017 TaxID=1339254 RepID=UPI00068F609A|nr:hypothetical protein [Chitinibacter sp. ZOR0017]